MSETISLGSLRFTTHSRVSDPRWLTVTVDAGTYEDQFSLRLEDWLSLKMAADVIAAADWTISDLRAQVSGLKSRLSDAVQSAEDFNAQRVEVGRAYRRVLEERDAANRELERWRHGVTIEGDFVCPDSLERDDLRTQLSEALLKCDVLRAELDRAAVEIAKLRREG